MHTAALHAALEGGVPRAVLATISDMRADGFVPNISLYNKVRVVGKARGNVKDAFVKVRKATAAQSVIFCWHARRRLEAKYLIKMTHFCRMIALKA